MVLPCLMLLLTVAVKLGCKVCISLVCQNKKHKHQNFGKQ